MGPSRCRVSGLSDRSVRANVRSEDATLELRVKTVKYFKSIEKVQDEVEAKYGSVGAVRLGLHRASAT
jgi:glucosamine-6-phosphate deaminase